MLRKLVFAVMSSSLLLGVLAAPVSAVSPPEVLEINAIPDTSIEICSGGKEHLNLRYGKAADWGPEDGTTETWTIRKSAPGKCKGKKLARFSHTFYGGTSYTVVYWKPKTGVKKSVFENELAIDGAGNATMTVRHMAQVKAADVWIWQKFPRIATVPDEGPTVNALGRGQSTPVLTTPARDSMFAVYPDKAVRRWHSAYGAKKIKAGNAYQVLIMGNKQSNMKVKAYAVPGYYK